METIAIQAKSVLPMQPGSPILVGNAVVPAISSPVVGVQQYVEKYFFEKRYNLG